METGKLKSLIIQYREIQAEEEDLCQRRRDSKGEFEGLDYNEGFNRWYELSRPLYVKKELIANEIKSLGIGVLVKEPNKVVGARIEKTQFNVRVFSCNTLDKIILSRTKQEGDVLTPYLIHLDGSTELTSEEHTYRIKRIGEQVYWILGTKDFLKDTYGVERM